jgi:hypothetical protein
LHPNGRLLASKPVTAVDFKRIEFTANYAPGILEAVAFRNNHEIARRRLTPSAQRQPFGSHLSAPPAANPAAISATLNWNSSMLPVAQFQTHPNPLTLRSPGRRSSSLSATPTRWPWAHFNRPARKPGMDAPWRLFGAEALRAESISQRAAKA